MVDWLTIASFVTFWISGALFGAGIALIIKGKNDDK